jgi:hypothetical protein
MVLRNLTKCPKGGCEPTAGSRLLSGHRFRSCSAVTVSVLAQRSPFPFLLSGHRFRSCSAVTVSVLAQRSPSVLAQRSPFPFLLSGHRFRSCSAVTVSVLDDGWIEPTAIASRPLRSEPQSFRRKSATRGARAKGRLCDGPDAGTAILSAEFRDAFAEMQTPGAAHFGGSPRPAARPRGKGRHGTRGPVATAVRAARAPIAPGVQPQRMAMAPGSWVPRATISVTTSRSVGAP